MAPKKGGVTVIIIMGASGAGKSTFIDRATESKKNHAKHDLEPGPGKIRAFPYSKDGEKFELLDTPGLDVNDSNIGILGEIVNWVKAHHPQAIMSLRVIYLHKITETRLIVSPLDVLGALASVAKGRGGAVASVVVATTMWNATIDAVKAGNRQRLLEDTEEKLAEYKIMRFENTFTSAWDIANSVVDKTPVGLQGLLEEAIPATKKGRTTEGVTAEAGLIEICKRFFSRVTRRES